MGITRITCETSPVKVYVLSWEARRLLWIENFLYAQLGHPVMKIKNNLKGFRSRKYPNSANTGVHLTSAATLFNLKRADVRTVFSGS